MKPIDTHTEDCACPVCRSRRGERTRNRLHVQFALSGEEASMFAEEARRMGLPVGRAAKSIIQEWLKKPWR